MKSLLQHIFYTILHRRWFSEFNYYFNNVIVCITIFCYSKCKEALTRKGLTAGISTEDISKIEAVVYVMADKFLDQVDMDEIKEGISMTRLGQMLVEMGRNEGLKIGRTEGLKAGRSEGREEVNKLHNRLIKEGKYKELERATEDAEYQKHLIAEYGIS